MDATLSVPVPGIELAQVVFTEVELPVLID